MDGIILQYDRKSATGVVEARDGRLFAFSASGWRARVLPRRRDRVAFEAEDGEATDVHFPSGREPAGAAIRKAADAFDMGYIAGVYAIVFFVAAMAMAVLNIVLTVMTPGEEEIQILFGAFVILAGLTAAAWMWGSRYRKLRGFASIVAGTGVVALAVILVKNVLLPGSG